MTRYYKQHVCIECGVRYKAYGPASVHCPECVKSVKHFCKRCGVEFRPRSLEAEYCTKHRQLGSKAYNVKYATRRETDPEVILARKKKSRAEYMQRKRARMKLNSLVTDVVKAVVAPKARVMLDAREIIAFKPVKKQEAVKALPNKPEDKFFLRVNAKTVYGFVSEERMEAFKKRNGIA